MKKQNSYIETKSRLMYDKYHYNTYMRIFFQFVLMIFFTYVIGEKDKIYLCPYVFRGEKNQDNGRIIKF